MSLTDKLYTPIDSKRIITSHPLDDLDNRALLLVMHGYGNNHRDFLETIQPWLPRDVVVVNLRAPLNLSEANEVPAYASPNGSWGWFLFKDPQCPPPVGLKKAAVQVLEWLKTLNPKSIGLLGFSQGGAMTIELLRQDPERFDYAVNLSGFVLDTSSRDQDEKLKAGVWRSVGVGEGFVRELRRPEVFWALGEADNILPQSVWDQTQAWLLEHTIPEIRLYAGQDHSINHQEMLDVEGFIRRHLNQSQHTRRPVSLKTQVIYTQRWSEDPPRLEDRDLVILLHGYGSHENDLTRLFAPRARLIGQRPPLGLPGGPVYVSLQAPIPEAMGYAWFSREEENPYSIENADVAAAALLAWLDRAEDRFGHPKTVSLVGFSQGAALALHLYRTCPERFCAIASLAGFLVGNKLVGDLKLRDHKRPVFYALGEEDQVLDPQRVASTCKWLPEHCELTLREYPDAAHEIPETMVEDLSEFLTEKLSLSQT